MDKETSPSRTSKRRKSDETEENDNVALPSTSTQLQNENANLSDNLKPSCNDELDKAIVDSIINVGERAEPEVDVDVDVDADADADVDVTSPTSPPSLPRDGGEADSDFLPGAAEVRFRTRGRRLAAIRPRNYRSRMITSSSSSSLDSLTEVVVREPTRRPHSRPPSEPNEASSESDLVHTSAPEFSLDSSITSDSDTNNYEDFASSNDEAGAGDEVDDQAFNEIMNKPKPNYTWNVTSQVMHREHGLLGNGRRSLHGGLSNTFQSRFYGSRHVVEKMKLLHSMHKHSGCVNCLNFNRSGNLLCTGSDDMRVIVWDWAMNKTKFQYKSGHQANIFQTKFIEMNGCMDIVSTSRDGQVRAASIPPSGGKIRTRALYKHSSAVHKLVLCPQNPFVILSAGEDGKIVCCDLRKSPVNRLKTVKEDRKKVPLYSIAHHPFDPEICVCGNDSYVRVYDKRNMSKTLHKMCPQRIDDQTITPHITCCVYNNNGSEILASYSDDDIYLFNSKVYTAGQFEHRYRGHYNHKTIKGVNFFGPNSEYVISGSDCGNIFFWDKNTESILNFMEGDNSGVVNCLEPHPTIPVLATSGLDWNIKIWAPNSEIYPPVMTKLDKCVKKNLKRSVVEEIDGFDDRQFYYFVRQFLRNSRPSDNQDNAGTDPDAATVRTSSSESDEDEYNFSNDQMARVFQPSCHPQ
ncbi:DDB1- and CUL4-associated factor 8-like [Eupeodes corollae]|uniref:DDB1- and CUL4-associated factor 8-like n=1 Tax=Eupeodes corollae TaxID=290404 RepID=UPI002493611E|nr:DDB1- and CUL4-associated factor 8-like [Eupeodes corollae]